MMQIPVIFALAAQPGGCRVVNRPEIFVSDLAAAIPAFSPLPQELRVGYSPLPGSLRVFHGSELGRIAKSHGLELGTLPDVCFKWQVATPKNEDLLTAMRAAVGNPDAKIEIVAA